MVVALVASAALLLPPPDAIFRGFVPSLPQGAGPAVLGLVGGIGGSITLLAYGYWIREHGWAGAASAARVRLDLGVAYALTGLFGMAVLVLASRALGGGAQELPTGSKGLVALADTLQGAVGARALVLGAVARAVFLLGVWAAVFTSVLGVWQGVPYLFADLQSARAGRFGEAVDVRSRPYRLYLLYLAIAPMALLLVARPFWLILAYGREQRSCRSWRESAVAQRAPRVGGCLCTDRSPR
jgi:hypothetical protein